MGVQANPPRYSQGRAPQVLANLHIPPVVEAHSQYRYGLNCVDVRNPHEVGLIQ